jgi:hypothetical protein
LSAAHCIPFTSCNAGTFGGGHAELYPLVGFFARTQAVAPLLQAAGEARVGLENHDNGCLVVYASDVRNLRLFAASIMRNRKAFDALRVARPRRRKDAEQSQLEHNESPPNLFLGN